MNININPGYALIKKNVFKKKLIKLKKKILYVNMIIILNLKIL